MKYTPEVGRRRLAQRRERGLCLRCGKPNNNGKTQCDACCRKRLQQFYARKFTGKCGYCGGSMDSNGTQCAACRTKGKAYYAECVAQRRCVRCGEPLAAGNYRTCEACCAIDRQNRARLQEQRRNAGLCVYCGKESYQGPGKCRTCANKKEAERLRLIRQGRCVRCRKPSDRTDIKHCNNCVLVNLAYKTFGDASKVVLLTDLFDKQDGRCALSGRPIRIGVDAELDHIIPVSRGGMNVIDNYQWLHADVNQAKRGLLDSEFLALVGDVYDYRLKRQRERRQQRQHETIRLDDFRQMMIGETA